MPLSNNENNHYKRELLKRLTKTLKSMPSDEHESDKLR